MLLAWNMIRKIYNLLFPTKQNSLDFNFKKQILFLP